MTVAPSDADPITETLAKLVEDSTDHHYNPYTRFDWPQELTGDRWWMSPDLLTIAGTPWADSFDEQAVKRLSKWECVNFFSLNIHGIRELLLEVTRRIHTSGFEVPSEFFHRFLGEENGHMWFFAQFSRRYGGKIYPDRTVHFEEETTDLAVANFLVFARILIFEELVDHFNIRMGRDSSLQPIVQELNQAHHDDEWRHIVMGRKLVDHFYEPLHARGDQALLASLDDYLQRYLVTSIQSLYNPAAYRDAGLPDPYRLRTEVLEHPSRIPYHVTFMRRITGFLMSTGIISQSPFQK
jgi:hypothetical protein